MGISFDKIDGVIWYDGKLVPWADANVHILTHGLHYASCVFEGEHVVKSAEHSERLKYSANILDFEIPYSVAEIDAAKQVVIDRNNLPDAYLRPIAWRGVVAAAVAAVLAVLGSPTGVVRAQDRSPVIDLSSGNAEMNAAIAKAKATLPTFWASYDAPKPSETGHSLKARFANPRNDGEHIWIAEVKKIADGRYSGRFANTPRDLPGKAGDVVEFKEADISDWMFMRNGKIVGGETIKPLLKAMPKADADALRARMETP